jgi:hypothetical protein
MTKNKTKVLFLCIMFLIGCKNRTLQEKKDDFGSQSQSPVIIDIERDFGKDKEFRLSEIADDIEYVKLEKSPKSFVGGGIPSYYVTKEYIFIYSSQRLLQFYRNGKYIKEIGKNGRGPGEFLSIRGMALNELNHTFYIISNYTSKVLKYDVNTGTFLGDFPINADLGSAMLTNALQIIGSDTFIALSHPIFQFTPNYLIFEIFDDKGNVLIKKKSSLFSFQAEDKNVRGKTSFTQIWFFGEQFRLFEDLNDTIYTIKNSQLEPSYIFNLGKYKGSFSAMTTNYVNETKNYIRLFGFWETPKYLFFNFFYNGKVHNGQFDKIGKEFHQLIETSNNSNKMYNDIDGGLSFWPFYSVEHLDNEWICCFDAIDLKKQLSDVWLKTSEAKYPEKKEKLKKFMDELSIDDNPVLIIVKLKK